MKKLSHFKQVPYLFGIVCLALFALMAFQIHWLTTSKDLIEEQFEQKVNLAMGSALSDFYRLKEEPGIPLQKQCGATNFVNYLSTPMPDIGNKAQNLLEERLSTYMACYGIDEKYRMGIFSGNQQDFAPTYCSAINVNSGCKDPMMLGISFISREAYMYSKMGPMILSSILIFLLLASVSFMVLWSLVKQKRITENNIDFFNNTAHELKTPLTNISLALKLLKAKHTEIEDNKYAQVIQAENSKLAYQIERVLSLARLENGEYSLKKEVIDLEKILGGVVEEMSLIAEERGGQIKLELPDTKPQILGDYYHLSNVFRNLIDNALKYSNDPPRIKISMEEDDKHIRLQFKDNGIGISQKDQDHIFEKFQRVNTGNVRESKGFGIGLSYVKTIMEMHKGFVKVESELHKGSLFQLLIPAI
ncbi:MAG: HAMP domain-containing sensor histidine kinase [Bacteroidota bacterium]